MWQGIAYFLLTIGLEFLPPHKLNLFTAKECWKRLKKIIPKTSNSYSEPLLESSQENVGPDLDEDVDVQTERNRVLTGSVDNAIIYLRNLRKVFIFSVLSWKFSMFIYLAMAYMFHSAHKLKQYFSHFRSILVGGTMTQKLQFIHWLSQFKKGNVLAF